MPSCPLGQWARRAICRSRSRSTSDNDEARETLNEKQEPPKAPRDWLATWAAVLRSWQWSSAAVVYGCFLLLSYADKSEQIPVRVIEGLAYGSIMYHTTVLVFLVILRHSKQTAGWRVFSLATLVGDFLMMGLALSKLTVLSAAGVLAECPGPSRMDYFRNNVQKITAAFGFGSGVQSEPKDGMDLLCCLPKAVYILSFIAIFTYTLTVLLAGLQLQKHWHSRAPYVHKGDMEEAIPAEIEPVQMPLSRASLSAIPRREEVPVYSSTPDEIVPRTRSSQETTSSFNPELYLVSDGFRPDRPPSYRSRPPSYSSKPSSLRSVEF